MYGARIGPSPFRFHRFEGHPTQDVLQCGTDPDAMTVHRIEACCTCRSIDYFDEFWLSQGAMSVLVAICEEVTVCG